MIDGILGLGKRAVLWLSICLLGFLTLVSLVSTSYFNAETSFGEHPQYRTDSWILNLLFLAAFFAVLYAADRRFHLDRLPTNMLAAAAVLFVAGVSILWIETSYTYPEADQKAVSWVAWLASRNDYLFFRPGKYMQVYPNQLGLVAILEALYRITGEENWKAFMYLTAISNGSAVYLLYRITDRLFSKKQITHLVLLLSAGCMQIMLYSTFLYGITLGLSLSLASFYFLLKALDGQGNRGKFFCFAFLSAVFMGASILVKNNYSIVLVALVLLLLYKGLKKRSRKPVCVALMLLVVCLLMGKSLTAFYEARCGIEIGSGMPKTLWIAMGMQEGERAEGWYNEFNYNTFLETGCDSEKSDAIARESIKKSLQYFREHPAYALRFYYKKTVSQWNEPTYAALWVNQFHRGDFSKIVQSIYEGKLCVVFHEYMNLYQSLIFAAVFACLLIRRKSWSMEQLFFLIVILGGFCFHTIWEAKSQYIYPYFVMLLPCAAAGISDVCGVMEEKIRIHAGGWRRKQDEK